MCKKRERYSQINDDDLDEIMSRPLSEYPRSGLRMLLGHLLRMDIRVPRQRLRESLLLVDHYIVLLEDSKQSKDVLAMC